MPLFRQSLREGLWLLLGCAAVMFAFHWIFVWLTSLFPSSKFLELVQDLPGEMQNMFGMSLQEAATPTGRIAMAYVDLTVVVVSSLWAIARGSNTVSGPLDRGTLEMVLAQPVRRVQLLVADAVVTLLGCCVLGAAAWLGTWVGIQTVSVELTRYHYFVIPYTAIVPLTELVDPADYLPAAMNLAALAICTSGIAALVSSLDRYRWRTIGIMGGFCLVQVVLKVIALGSSTGWLYYATYFGAYWPQRLAVAPPEESWQLLLQYGGTLSGIGLVCYVAAGVVFQRRDLPAPL